MTRTSYISIR